MKAALSGWGRFPKAVCDVSRPRGDADVRRAIEAGPLIARGMGRAYGDSALNRASVLDMTAMNRMLSFDAETGILVAEAGVTLAEIVETFLPRGWFPAVTPGTRFVSIGGAAAADVHGKNHHRDGGFGDCVAWIEIIGADGVVRRASRDAHPDLFARTIGGMGLTGVILRAAIRLHQVETGWIRQETVPCPTLEAAMAEFDASADARYSVAWIDCLAGGDALGRSLLVLGDHARLSELGPREAKTPLIPPPRRRLRAPIDAPGWALNGWTVRAFNHLYHARGQRAAGAALVGWESYFYPLDAVDGWNRIYGRRGFAQFQCVIPDESAAAGLRAILEATSAAGQGSFLAVLKKLGAGAGAFSFPMPGYTLALDFPASRRALSLLARLDAIVADHGGRFYLAKDARMPAAVLARTDPRAAELAAWRRKTGAAAHFTSLQSERLGL